MDRVIVLVISNLKGSWVYIQDFLYIEGTYMTIQFRMTSWRFVMPLYNCTERHNENFGTPKDFGEEAVRRIFWCHVGKIARQ